MNFDNSVKLACFKTGEGERERERERETVTETDREACATQRQQANEEAEYRLRSCLDDDRRHI